MAEGLDKVTKRRIFLVYLGSVLFALVILYQVFHIQFAEGDELRKKSEEKTVSYRNIEASRGDILACDGSLLATSVPIYEIRLDLCPEALTDEIFNSNIDSLAWYLSDLFNDVSTADYKDILVRARTRCDRYYLLRRNIKYDVLRKLRSFPIFRLGRNRGGFIAVLDNKKRELPFRLLAARTIGYDREGISVGLEGAYSSDLLGVSGKMLMRRISGNIWMPLTDQLEIEPRDGNDILTTIDIHLQDVAENALLEQLKANDADHGCVVLMEVATGYIKAIANLSRIDTGRYFESYNYAVGESTEPGSTFKLASIICALEDGFVDIDDSIETGDGRIQYYDDELTDSRIGGYGTITVKQAFEYSSNVGISKIITENYGKNPEKFIEGLQKLGLDKPLGIEISGEGQPMIKKPGPKSGWSGLTLPWMSIGYELQLTPLQILTFYNAVANNGKLMKPRFVKEIQRAGKRIKRLDPVVLNEQICSKSTIRKARKLLEGVVENGTAKNLKEFHIKIAGKTGTVQIANDKYGYKYNTRVSYQASFAGYFPAEDPQYSCIVVVNAPSKHVYYGNLVAGPIFKEIAEKVYSTRLEMHDELVAENTGNVMPRITNGRRNQLATVIKGLGFDVNSEDLFSEYVDPYVEGGELKLKKINFIPGKVPDVTGMSLKDAIFLLENMGLRVKVSGKGEITGQSLKAGTKYTVGSGIHLTLSPKA
ncbi:MAG: transpeptidase family protein [Bacteroidetes bacterium]|nr:transpeptidase family protein [Bacteroidota bacterium]